MKNSKYKVGDLVLIKNYIDPNGVMIGAMLEEFGGRECTISGVFFEADYSEFPYSYEVAEDYDPKYRFVDNDIECLASEAN